MGVLESEDRKRYFVEKNIEVANKHYDEKTQLVYFDEEDPYDQNSKKASLLLNLGYVFALFRTKNCDNILRAKSLLKKLLCFQVKTRNANLGGFPKYIHQYPNPYDNRSCVHIYVILYKLDKLFSKVIEKPLRVELSKAITRLKSFIEKMYTDYGYGEDIEPLVSLIIGKKPKKKPFVISSKHLETFVFMHAYSPVQASKYLDVLQNFWNEDLGCYAGPYFHEHFEKSLLRPTLFNLFMSCESGKACVFDDHYIYLLSSLIMPKAVADNKEKSFSQNLIFNEMSAVVKNDETSSLFYFENFKAKEKDSYPNGFHTLSYLFRSLEDAPNSLVCQTKNVDVAASENEGVISVDFTYPKLDVQDKKVITELNFFLLKNDEVNITVDHEKATIFKLSETLRIETSDRTLEFTFKVIEGSGDILGGISMGNRPSQIYPDAINPNTKSIYKAFDWKISLRSLRRDEGFKLNMQLKTSLKQPLEEKLLDLQEQDCQEIAP
ncbi:MAG: hypothetical protein S4CHLAM37_14500 [Chlamydiia bacterium]|nr:hypothetical protein [Chlamydiia bacterium]